MTRKLTDEQVHEINGLRQKSLGSFIKIEITNGLNIVIQTGRTSWQVYLSFCNQAEQRFTSINEAIAYAEHLLNQRYCWLPQNNCWIMSGEKLDYTNNGVNRVFELMMLAKQVPATDPWYTVNGKSYYYIGKTLITCAGIPLPFQFDCNDIFMIDPESPIWDAVKGVE